MPYHSAFCHKKFEFGLVHKEENITTHSSEKPNTVQHKHDEVNKVLLNGLKQWRKGGIPDYAIIHSYMKCTGMDQDFIICDAGAKRKNVKQLLHGEAIIDKIAELYKN